MRVIQVVSGINNEASGPSYSVPGLCRGLMDVGVKVGLHTVHYHEIDVARFPFKVVEHPLSLWGRWIPGASRSMLAALRRECQTADIIHANALWMMPDVYPGWAVKGTKCKLVVAPRGSMAAWSMKKGWLKKKIFGWLLQNRVLRRADMFHATSEKEYEEIRALGYKQPVAIVPIGMDIPDVSQFVSNSNTLNSKTQTLRQVVFFGRLHKVKAVDRLVRAWEILTKEQEVDLHSSTSTSNFNSITNWELVIAGPDNGIRGELEQYIAEHKIPRVRFVGEINGPAKYEFLADADLYVLPSHTENFAVTVAEALACGTPVIVSKGTPWQGVAGLQGCGVAGLQGRAEGRGNRSTVEFGNQSISRRALAEKKVDEWLRGVTRESLVTIEVSSRGEKKPPRLVPLTEAVQTVVHHQTTAGSYPSDTRNISNSLDLCNGLPSCVGNRAGLMNSEDQQRGAAPDPNSEKGRNEAVGVREASGETLVKPVCQPSELTQFVALEPGDTFDQIEQYLRQRVSETFENKTLGISASIGSKRNANELAKHMAAGESPEVHKFAAKNIGALFERGVVGFTHLDKKAMPDQRWIARFVRVLSLFVFGGERFIATLTLKAERAGGRLYAVEAVEINQDVKLRSTPRGAISKDLNSAPILNLTSQLTNRIAYYVGDVKRTHPAFLGRSEPFSIERAVDLIRMGGDDKSKLKVEGEEEGRGNRSTVESISAPSGALPSGGSDRVAEILSDGATGPSPLADAEHSDRGPVSGTIGNVEASCCRSRSACGFWVSNDPETLAKTLREAMSLSDAERRQMGEVGREWIRRDFSWEGVGAKMKAAYEWLLDPEHVAKPEWVKVV